MPQFSEKDALLIVDTQNCFMPDGTVPVPDGDEVVPVLNRWIEKAQREGVFIAASRDWHPPNHTSFEQQGGPWKPHCVQDTEGAAFHPDLRLPENAVVVSKGDDPDEEAYSAFQGTGLARKLREQGIETLWVGGLALDYCVKETVLDALREGFDVRLIRSATRAVNAEPGDGEKALREMRKAGASIVENAGS
ncbi:MAG: isochorismatase family protein [Candidatus Eisenbacteria bacterium]|nr:isochorismatase family protein [Candidatus Eisenbacteria bacterium]